jgi:hypothetical protein
MNFKPFALGMLLLTLPTVALAAPKAYQVTGTVLEVRGDTVVVEKGKEKWELALGAVKATGGELAVGAKVTIEYTMAAKSIEVKPAPAGKPAKK